jgi:MSHA biogenesis protein MshL
MPKAPASVWAAALCALLAGCATGFQRDFRSPKVDVTAAAPAVQDMAPAGEAGEIDLARGIGVTPNTFYVRSHRPNGGDLPPIVVRNLSVSESGLQDALQLAIEGAGLSLNVEGGARALEHSGAVSVYGLSGPLREVLDRLAEAMGFFWSVKGKVITIEPDRQFVVELPPVLAEDSLAGMANTMQFLGARNAHLDRIARTLVFRANAKVLARIEDYLAEIRATRALIIYQLQIFQVDLNDSSQQGVKWDQLIRSSQPLASPALGTSGAVPAALAQSMALLGTQTGFGAILAGPRFSIDLMVDFLKTQGTVRTISQPRIALLAGSKGTLRVGETNTFISRIGSNISSGVSQVTAETRELQTGLQLSLIGELSDNTVYTHIALGLSALLSNQQQTILGTSISLPRVTGNELDTVIRLPAGYTAFLGGITVDRHSQDRGIGISQNTTTNAVTRSELVIAVKPTVIHFEPRKTAAAAARSSGAASTPENTTGTPAGAVSAAGTPGAAASAPSPAGAPPEPPKPATAAPQAAPTTFEIEPGDRDLAASLKRWGRAAGYEVLWESPISAPIDTTGSRTLTAPDFKALLDRSIDELRRLGYPLKALIYSDKVVRIVNTE